MASSAPVSVASERLGEAAAAAAALMSGSSTRMLLRRGWPPARRYLGRPRQMPGAAVEEAVTSLAEAVV